MPFSKQVISDAVKKAYKAGKSQIPKTLHERIPVAFERAKDSVRPKRSDYSFYRDLMTGIQRPNQSNYLDRAANKIFDVRASKNPAVQAYRESLMNQKKSDLSKVKQAILDMKDKDMYSKIQETKMSELAKASEKAKMDLAERFSKTKKSFSDEEIRDITRLRKNLEDSSKNIGIGNSILEGYDLKIDPVKENILNEMKKAKSRRNKLLISTAVPLTLAGASYADKKLKDKNNK